MRIKLLLLLFFSLTLTISYAQDNRSYYIVEDINEDGLVELDDLLDLSNIILNRQIDSIPVPVITSHKPLHINIPIETHIPVNLPLVLVEDFDENNINVAVGETFVLGVCHTPDVEDPQVSFTAQNPLVELNGKNTICVLAPGEYELTLSAQDDSGHQKKIKIIAKEQAVSHN